MQFPIFDGHNDALLAAFGGKPEQGVVRDLLLRDDRGHFDLPRAQEGGFAGGFFAVFVPAPPEQRTTDGSDLTITAEGYDVALAPSIERAYALDTAMLLASSLFRLETRSGGAMCVVRTHRELVNCIETGVMAAVLHFEGAEPIDPDLVALDVFYQAGLRSLGIVWSRPNAFGHGVPFRYPATPDTGPGLTVAGQELVRACNRLGIMLDLAHLNEQGFWDVASISTCPLVVTHATAHAICPMTRNLTDLQLDAIRDSHGMVGLNFEVSANRPDSHDEPDTPLGVLVDQIDYLVERMGIDCVGFGSDFDGARMPAELGDVAGLPRLIAALEARGYDEAALRKLAYENWLRVLGATWRD